MEKRELHWRKSKYLFVLCSIILSCASLISYPKFLYLHENHKLIIQLLGFVFFGGALFSIYLLIRKLFIPELEFNNGVFKFFARQKDKSKRKQVPVRDIDSIFEVIDDPSEVGLYIGAPTFLIKTKSGEEYEYTPEVKDQKRVDDIKRFLRDIPGMPLIKSATSESIISSDLQTDAA